eukprot:gene16751-35169_t
MHLLNAAAAGSAGCARVAAVCDCITDCFLSKFGVRRMSNFNYWDVFHTDYYDKCS